MQFKELPLHQKILKAVAEARFHKPTLVQRRAIPEILNKKNVIVSAQTGTGKTAAFALPIINLLFDKQDVEKDEKNKKALVITPTRELAIQILANFKSYSKYSNLRSTAVFGGVSLEPQKKFWQKV